MNRKLGSKKNFAVNLVAYLVLGIGGIFMLYPFIFCFLGSLLTKAEYLNVSLLPLPGDLSIGRFANLLKFFDHPDVWSSILVTLFRFVFYAVWNVFTSVLAGYIFARVNFRGKTFVFFFFMASMMVPGIATMYPVFLMYAKWPLAGGNNILGAGGSGFVGSLASLFIGGWVNPYNIFLIRLSVYDMGSEMSEAAEIDGAGNLRVIFSIYLPMLKPIMAVVVINLFISMWNDYMSPMVYMQGTSTPELIPIGYKVFEIIARAEGSSSMMPDYPAIFGVCFTAMLPPIIVFICLQKYFITGLSMGAVKG